MKLTVELSRSQQDQLKAIARNRSWSVTLLLNSIVSDWLASPSKSKQSGMAYAPFDGDKWKESEKENPDVK